MRCIYCAGGTQVINSRPQKRLNRVWRRRQCQTCHATFTTHESAALADNLRVRTASGRLTNFQQNKLFLSLYKACEHRAGAVDDATALTDTVVAQISPKAVDGVLQVTDIIQAALQTLQRFDTAAHIHYQAFHPIKS